MVIGERVDARVGVYTPLIKPSDRPDFIKAEVAERCIGKELLAQLGQKLEGPSWRQASSLIRSHAEDILAILNKVAEPEDRSQGAPSSLEEDWMAFERQDPGERARAIAGWEWGRTEGIALG